jgi:ribosomal protein S18 acetylase RimI-like enzyme
MLLSERERYPSHLHINLLPGARRRGTGRRLLSVLFHELARAGSLGVQLGVRADNTGAQAFYRSMGMRQLRSEEQAPVRFGRPLRERPTPFGTMGAD